MNFEEILIKWNGGVVRGAQTNLAKRLGIAPNAISQWVSGKNLPSEDLRPKLAKELGITVDRLMESLRPEIEYSSTRKAAQMFVRDAPHGAQALTIGFSKDEWDLLKKKAEEDRRDPAGEVRWLVFMYGKGKLVQAQSIPGLQGQITALGHPGISDKGPRKRPGEEGNQKIV